jgi:hypothetical protein
MLSTLLARHSQTGAVPSCTRPAALTAKLYDGRLETDRRWAGNFPASAGHSALQDVVVIF